MSDIFREVDEALQREKAARLWKEYGPTLVLSAVVLIISTGIVSAYRAWDAGQDKKETSELLIAGKKTGDKAITALEEAAKETRGGHRAVALMSAAGQYAAEKEFTKAAALYEQIAQDSSIDQDFRDLAVILDGRAKALAAQPSADEIKKQAERLLPIAKNGKSAFQAQAKLEAALLYGDGLKDYAAALDLLKGIAEESKSDSLKEKATALSHVYEYELSKSKEAPKAAPASAASTDPKPADTK